MTRRERLVVFGIGLAFWAAVALPVLGSGGRWGIWDWDHHLAFYEVERAALLEFATLPLWAPWLAGGSVSLQHPLSSFLWPDFAWVLLFGVPYGVKLLLAFRFGVGLWGAWLLARSHDLRPLPALLASVVMMGSGAWAAHVAFGHFEWTLFGYAPWALYALRRARTGRSALWTGIAAAFIAGLYLGGGIYLLVGFALLLGLLSAFEALATRDWRCIALAVLALALSAPFSAAKLLPTAAHFAENPRTTNQRNLFLQHEPARGWLEVPRALRFVFLERDFDATLEFAKRPSHVDRRGSRDESLARWALFQEINYDAYVGALVLLLASAGVLLVPARWPWCATLVAMALLVLSDSLQRAFGIHPWWALKKLPALGSLGVAGRFAIFAAIPLALLAGAGLQALLGRLVPERARLAVAALAVLAVGADLGSLAAARMSRSFPHDPPLVERAPRFRTLDRPLAGYDLATVRARLGARRAHSNLVPVPRRPVRSEADRGYRGEAWLLGGGVAELREIVPNRARVRVPVGTAGVLVLNQLHVRGWRRADRDEPVFSHGGLVASRVSEEDRLVELEFRPPWLATGLAISALSVIAWLAIAWWPRRQ